VGLLLLLLLLAQAQVLKGIIKFGFCGSGAGVGCEHFCGGFYFFFLGFCCFVDEDVSGFVW
jgi:hypothetical protein